MSQRRDRLDTVWRMSLIIALIATVLLCLINFEVIETNAIIVDCLGVLDVAAIPTLIYSSWRRYRRRHPVEGDDAGTF